MRAGRFLSDLTDDLVELEVGPVSAELRERTRSWVQARVAGSGSVTRLGLRATGMLLSVVVVTATGRPYHRLPADRRRAVARRLAGTRLPLAAEYVKAIRSLAISYVYEARFATAP